MVVDFLRRTLCVTGGHKACPYHYSCFLIEDCSIAILKWLWIWVAHGHAPLPLFLALTTGGLLYMLRFQARLRQTEMMLGLVAVNGSRFQSPYWWIIVKPW